MKDLQMLSSIADEMFSGLTAGPALRQRILRSAGERGRQTQRVFVYRVAPVLTALVMVVGLGLLLANGRTPSPDDDGTRTLRQIAGGAATQQPLPVIAAADVPDGSVRVTNVEDAPKFTSYFAGSGANFPLVGLDGKAYRRMSTSLPSRAVGSSLGSVSLFTEEPSLADNEQWRSGIISNSAAEGASVYEISGLSVNTAVAAEVDGKTVLFQRVSYAGHGTAGQTLEDTLGIRGKVSELTLSGAGTVSDEQAANALIALLLDNASFYSDDSTRGKQSLTITLKSGVTLQLLVSGEVFSACGSWSCPEFFEAFQQAMD